MAIAENIRKAEALTRLGIAVFPVYVKPDGENPYKTTKKPGTEGGFYDATLDPGYVQDLFERHPNAEIGVWMGASGLVAADFDVKRSPDGAILVDGFEEFEKQWLDLPDTYSFDSISGSGGKQYIYAAPEDKVLGPAGNYRGIKGVDRRGGGSYSVWAGEVPASRDVFAPAPEWLLDEKTVKTAEKYEGSVREWYDSLEPGEPNVLVRAAMERARKHFETLGKDFDHGAIIERQYEAVRLGAEGNPGVDQLLSYLEDLFMTRTGSHSRGEDEWEHEFMEGLVSGIQKHGASIALRKNLPAYNPTTIPASVPDRLIAGEPGNKDVFRDLLAALLPLFPDDLMVTSILWNSPRTRDLAREWGLEFVHQRVQDARSKPEPTRENPTLVQPEPSSEKVTTIPGAKNTVSSTFLSAEEIARVQARKTFIDIYLEATATKGFYSRDYDIPAAWTALSMAFGLKAVIPFGKPLGMNLWFLVMGESGTGKSSSDEFLTDLLDTMLKDGEGFYNLGAHSSPDGLHEVLLERDGLPSMIHHDEASDFFEAINKKDWMMALKDKFSDWYGGKVSPMTKVRLKDLKGKSARTSFNIHMLGTPDRLMGFLDTSMFASGFMARFNYAWSDQTTDDELRYSKKFSPLDNHHMVNPAVYDLALDLLHARDLVNPAPVAVSATAEATKRLEKAHRSFRTSAKKHERYESLDPIVTRLDETVWKCAALLALYDGRNEIELDDALTAIYYASDWYAGAIRAVEATGASDFSKDLNAIEAFVLDKGTVTRPTLTHRFQHMIQRSPRELEDRIQFLVDTGRINRYVVNEGKSIVYEPNGTN